MPTGITATFSGLIHDGGITKAGVGTLIFSGANTYTGVTTVSAGTLEVINLSGSATGANAVNVSSGATLAGTGTIAGPVTMAGGSILSPGDAPGTLSTGALALANTTSLDFYLDQPGIEGSPNDLVAVTGNLSLGGDLYVTEGPDFTTGSYPLFTYSGASPSAPPPSSRLRATSMEPSTRRRLLALCISMWYPNLPRWRW